MAKITFTIEPDTGAKQTAKVTGAAASAGLDTIRQFMATQFTEVTTPGTPAVLDINGNVVTPEVPPVTTRVPKWANEAEFFKSNAIDVLEGLAPRFPSAATKADADEIDAKIAALQAKRAALFAAARGEQ